MRDYQLLTRCPPKELQLYKDILVHIPSERPAGPVIEGSVSLAAAFGAQLGAVSAGYVSTNASYVMGAAIPAIFEMERERAQKRAEAALATFEEAAKKAGVSYTCRAMGESPSDAAKAIGAMARLYDLNIVLQPDSEQSSFDNEIPREVMFHSGGPVLFLPHIFRGSFQARRIGICWDGSRVAARALRDAGSFLKRAESITVITVNNADSAGGEASAENLVKRLERLKAPARIVASTAARADIQPTILSLAADENLDLLVMGGYGHSRIQENFLGGVTRAMLECMTVPTLMSH